MNVFGNEITSSNGKKRQRSNAVVGVAKRGVATAQPVRPGGGGGGRRISNGKFSL